VGRYGSPRMLPLPLLRDPFAVGPHPRTFSGLRVHPFGTSAARNRCSVKSISDLTILDAHREVTHRLGPVVPVFDLVIVLQRVRETLSINEFCVAQLVLKNLL
jgi:hypothetical protein